MKITPKGKLIFIGLHVLIGYLSTLLKGTIALKLSWLLIIIVFTLIVFFEKNRNEQAFFFAAYLSGAEVFIRMSQGVILYETGKYAVILILVVGIFTGDFKQKFSISITFYLLLLLLGIVNTRVPEGEYIRKALAFNLSGPIVLGISGLYFYKRKISVENLLRAIFFMILPLFSMLTYLYFKTPDLKEIVFGEAANFSTSGGFGPNQVATALGLGVFITTIFLLIKWRTTGFLLLDILVAFYFLYRGLLTFSRGGLVTGVLAVLSFAFFYTLSKKVSFLSFSKYIGFTIIFTVSTWLYTSNITQGMLVNRYIGKNARGIQKKDVSSGRVDILNEQFTSFVENPLGIGVGNGKYKRQGSIGKIIGTSHNEIGRLLEEHGIIGFFILILLLVLPLINFWRSNNFQRAFTTAFYLFWLLTINHSAMRIALPGFMYGLSLINIVNEEV